MQIKSIMRGRVVTVGPSQSISDVARAMANNRVGSVVIVKNGRPIGIVTREDIVKVVAHGKDIRVVKVSDLQQEKFITAKPTDDLKTVVETMVEEGVSRVPIIDNGKLVGVLTEKEILIADPSMADLLREKMKSRVSEVSEESEVISGICEKCSDFSEDLRHKATGWYCVTCRNDEEGISEEEEF